MADITDSRVIRYVNEVVRPMAERMRALKAQCDSALVVWYDEIAPLVTKDSTFAVVDGREKEGVSRLVGDDVINLVTQLAAFQGQMNTSGVVSVISKPCVRPLEAS
jgi:hypothetical protein